MSVKIIPQGDCVTASYESPYDTTLWAYYPGTGQAGDKAAWKQWDHIHDRFTMVNHHRVPSVVLRAVAEWLQANTKYLQPIYTQRNNGVTTVTYGLAGITYTRRRDGSWCDAQNNDIPEDIVPLAVREAVNQDGKLESTISDDEEIALRDMFAAGSLQSLLSDPINQKSPLLTARLAYDCADAMLHIRRTTPIKRDFE